MRATAVALAYVGTIAINALANALPLAGRTTGEISAMFPIPFTPAGWVFSIWGLIYLALGVYTVYQARPVQRQDALLDRVGWIFVASCMCNVGWLVAWHNVAIPATLPLMLGLFGCLLAVYGAVRRPTVAGDAMRPTHPHPRTGSDQGFRWAVRAPFSLYLGWITVATVANASIFLYDLGWQPGSDAAEAWSFALVLVAGAIGGWMLVRNRDAVFASVLVWAFAGIAAKEWTAPLLATGAVVAASILALMALRVLLRRVRRTRAA